MHKSAEQLNRSSQVHSSRRMSASRQFLFDDQVLSNLPSFEELTDEHSNPGFNRSPYQRTASYCGEFSTRQPRHQRTKIYSILASKSQPQPTPEHKLPNLEDRSDPDDYSEIGVILDSNSNSDDVASDQMKSEEREYVIMYPVDGKKPAAYNDKSFWVIDKTEILVDDVRMRVEKVSTVPPPPFHKRH